MQKIRKLLFLWIMLGVILLSINLFIIHNIFYQSSFSSSNALDPGENRTIIDDGFILLFFMR